MGDNNNPSATPMKTFRSSSIEAANNKAASEALHKQTIPPPYPLQPSSERSTPTNIYPNIPKEGRNCVVPQTLSPSDMTNCASYPKPKLNPQVEMIPYRTQHSNSTQNSPRAGHRLSTYSQPAHLPNAANSLEKFHSYEHLCGDIDIEAATLHDTSANTAAESHGNKTGVGLDHPYENCGCCSLNGQAAVIPDIMHLTSPFLNPACSYHPPANNNNNPTAPQQTSCCVPSTHTNNNNYSKHVQINSQVLTCSIPIAPSISYSSPYHAPSLCQFHQYQKHLHHIYRNSVIHQDKPLEEPQKKERTLGHNGSIESLVGMHPFSCERLTILAVISTLTCLATLLTGAIFYIWILS